MIRAVVLDLKRLGSDRKLLRAVLARIENNAELASPQLKRSLDELRDGNVAYLKPPAK